jgi:hypothetical protein
MTRRSSTRRAPGCRPRLIAQPERRPRRPLHFSSEANESDLLRRRKMLIEFRPKNTHQM